MRRECVCERRWIWQRRGGDGVRGVEERGEGVGDGIWSSWYVLRERLRVMRSGLRKLIESVPT